MMRYLRPLLLSIALLVGGCAVQLPVASKPASAVAEATFLALGDSYTIGQGVRAPERWPVQLAQLARHQGLRLRAPALVARTGWTTAELQAGIEQTHNHQQYDLVSLLIGVNNQYRGQSVATYRAEFRQLLCTAVHFAANRPGHVIVLSVPDWGQSPFGQRPGRDPNRTGAEVDQFNRAAQAECQEAGVAYINITPLTRVAAGDASQFTRDGLHYSGRQMRLWAEQALPVVRQLLR